jgi:hypothetical protein
MEARMNMVKLVLLTAIFIAMAFTFSCSSSDDDESGGSGGGIDMSGLPTQLYLDGEEYKGNGDIIIVFEKRDDDDKKNLLFSDTLPAGNIQNGQITLDLPENIDSKYLRKTELPSSFSYPNDLFDYDVTNGVIAIINGEKYEINLRGRGEEGLYLVYFSKSGKINGSYDDDGIIVTYDMDISKGWNAVWKTFEELGDGNYNWRTSTSRPQAAGELKWVHGK